MPKQYPCLDNIWDILTQGVLAVFLEFKPDWASYSFWCMCQEKRGEQGEIPQARSPPALPQNKADFPEGQTPDNKTRLNQSLLREPLCVLSSGGLRIWQAVTEAGSQQPTPRVASQGPAGIHRVALEFPIQKAGNDEVPFTGASLWPAMDTLRVSSGD